MSGALAELRVHTAVFDGPIDLLLSLANKQEVDLNQVRLADLTSGYLEALSATEARSADEMAAFLLVGSRLLALKAAALLPGPGEEEEEEDLEAWEAQVKQRMEEYERFKAAASELMRRHEAGGFAFTAAVEAEIVPSERLQIDGDGLARAFQKVLDRLPPPAEVAVELHEYSLIEEMDGIRERVRGAGRVNFTALFDAAGTRLHAVVIFLALLELVRGGEVKLRQKETYGEIEIEARAAEEADD